jgi:hypothetical protein
MLPVVRVDLLRMLKLPICIVTIVTRVTTIRLIAEPLPDSKSRKRLALKPNLDSERIICPSFLKKLIHSKGK